MLLLFNITFLLFKEADHIIEVKRVQNSHTNWPRKRYKQEGSKYIKDNLLIRSWKKVGKIGSIRIGIIFPAWKFLFRDLIISSWFFRLLKILPFAFPFLIINPCYKVAHVNNFNNSLNNFHNLYFPPTFLTLFSLLW